MPYPEFLREIARQAGATDPDAQIRDWVMMYRHAFRDLQTASLESLKLIDTDCIRAWVQFNRLVDGTRAIDLLCPQGPLRRLYEDVHPRMGDNDGLNETKFRALLENLVNLPQSA